MSSLLAPASKEALRKTIRELRERLLVDLHARAEGEYQLTVKPEKARLSEAQRVKRARLDAWLEEQVRSVAAKEQKDARVRFRQQAEKEAAYTLLHRLVVLRQLEAYGLVRPAVIAGCGKDWKQSQALRELSEHAPELRASRSSSGSCSASWRSICRDSSARSGSRRSSPSRRRR